MRDSEDKAMLNDLVNLWGPLPAATQERIQQFHKHSSKNPPKTAHALRRHRQKLLGLWDDIAGVIIDARPGTGLGVTLWQAWLAFDPTAPTKLVACGAWPTVPDVFTLHAAVLASRKAVDEKRWRCGLQQAGWLAALK